MDLPNDRVLEAFSRFDKTGQRGKSPGWPVGVASQHAGIPMGDQHDDGRVDAPLMQGDDMAAGRYEIVFHAAAYLRAGGTALPEVPFLDEIVIAFGIDNPDQHYHVPLLLSPYGYSTYRGS